MKNDYIDNEEKELIEAYNSVNFKKLKKPTKKEQQKVKAAAKEFLKKETKMNIRIDTFELNKIKKMAETEGLKYQTFVKSVLHKYISGQLVEKRHIV